MLYFYVCFLYVRFYGNVLLCSIACSMKFKPRARTPNDDTTNALNRCNMTTPSNILRRASAF